MNREPLPWAELVFHVLAHVRESADQAASLFDPAYVSAVAARLGPASSRTLAEDAQALGRLVASHEELARLQLVAWMFEDPAHASRFATTDLGELRREHVAAPEVLPTLASVSGAAELLRCAALLELPFFEQLDRPVVDWVAVDSALEQAAPTAPALAECDVWLLRSLRLRGRVRGDRIWVGTPDEALGPSLEHVVWQACHEATVRELGRAWPGAERSTEHGALVLLAERVRRLGRQESHARWLSCFGEQLPPLDRDALEPELRRTVAQLAPARSGT